MMQEIEINDDDVIMIVVIVIVEITEIVVVVEVVDKSISKKTKVRPVVTPQYVPPVTSPVHT